VGELRDELAEHVVKHADERMNPLSPSLETFRQATMHEKGVSVVDNAKSMRVTTSGATLMGGGSEIVSFV
jgi:hypothetical protein